MMARSEPPTPANASLPELHLVSQIELATLDRFALERRSRAVVSPLYLGDHRALCRLLGRYKFFIDTRDEGFGAHVLLDGFWEGWVTTFIARRLKPGMRFADIGANFGYYSILAADLCGPEGGVLAIEPNPAALELMRKSLAINGFAGRVTVLDAAASNTDGKTAHLLIPASEPKNAHLDLVVHGVTQLPGTPVRLVTADAALAGMHGVDFVKIDVEGHEEAVLEGLTKTIDRCRPDMIVEFNPRRCQDPERMLSLLLERYLKLQTLETDGELHPATPASLLSASRTDDWMLYLTWNP